ncbi:hypothetical protein [Dubosiella newyorkensis]|uniref:hypothetical protein n=1 Tax=Dubosiella newyorkensis TaxID=1862672 RepID=UPI0023F32FFB|nr:hypothetical protein [Dubosiella newyorkensis]
MNHTKRDEHSNSWDLAKKTVFTISGLLFSSFLMQLPIYAEGQDAVDPVQEVEKETSHEEGQNSPNESSLESLHEDLSDPAQKLPPIIEENTKEPSFSLDNPESVNQPATQEEAPSKFKINQKTKRLQG